MNFEDFLVMISLNLLDLGYRKIPKLSPGAYIFQRPFLRRLFLEGLTYGVNLPFLLCFTLYLRVIFLVQAPGGLMLEDAI